jgi:hypothetical protein
MSSGIEHPHVIDVIAHDPASDAVTLIMRESRPWSGGDEQLFQLQEKLNAYLSFALDGEMAEAYPAFIEKPLKLRIDCVAPPDERTVGFLGMVREQIALREIDLEVHVLGPAACGPACGCREAAGSGKA